MNNIATPKAITLRIIGILQSRVNSRARMGEQPPCHAPPLSSQLGKYLIMKLLSCSNSPVHVCLLRIRSRHTWTGAFQHDNSFIIRYLPNWLLRGGAWHGGCFPIRAREFTRDWRIPIMRRVIALGVAMLFIAGVVSVGVAAEKASHRTMTHKVVGEVVSVDPTAKTLSIKETLKKGGEAKEMSFTLADNVKVMVHGKAGALTDL